MIGVFDHYHCSVIGVEEIEPQETRAYGVIEGKAWDDRVFRISGVVEKPEPAQAPSNLGVVGRYVLTPGIFDHLRKTRVPAASRPMQSSRCSPTNRRSRIATTASVSTAAASWVI